MILRSLRLQIYTKLSAFYNFGSEVFINIILRLHIHIHLPNVKFPAYLPKKYFMNFSPLSSVRVPQLFFYLKIKTDHPLCLQWICLHHNKTVRHTVHLQLCSNKRHEINTCSGGKVTYFLLDH